MNISIDKARLGPEDQDSETVNIDDCSYVVEGGDLKVYKQVDNGSQLHPGTNREQVAYFPAGKWDCVYPHDKEDDE